MKKQMQQGFTLIELMIVVAIIGILASIALPAYQDYIARAQATEGITLMTGLKPTITEVYADQGSFENIESGAFGIAAAEDIAGKYVANVAVSKSAITATFKETGVSTELKGKTITLTPTDSNGVLTWTCTTNAPKKLVPASCRAS
jgi:type IV pilus assembly protein PilA